MTDVQCNVKAGKYWLTKKLSTMKPTKAKKQKATWRYVSQQVAVLYFNIKGLPESCMKLWGLLTKRPIVQWRHVVAFNLVPPSFVFFPVLFTVSYMNEMVWRKRNACKYVIRIYQCNKLIEHGLVWLCIGVYTD